MVLPDWAREVYARQILMEEIGEQGQQKLLASSVLVVGCGGLGSPVLLYLAAMGIGHIGLADCDVVSFSNLNRQILYTPEDVGKSKAATAAERIQKLNPELRLTVYDCYFDAALAEKIVPEYDMAVDCLDNFSTRFILNDACVEAGRPFVHAGVSDFYGQLLTIMPGEGPCLRCLFPEGDKKKPPDKPFGIIGATAAVLGAMQATETLKCLLGLPLNKDGFLLYNGLTMSCEKVALLPSETCFCRKKAGA